MGIETSTPTRRGMPERVVDGARRLRVVRAVAVASATGAYGGPFDTSVRQAQVMRRSGSEVIVVAAAFHGDVPRGTPFLRTTRARRVTRRLGFAGVFSIPLVPLLWRSIRSADVVHVSAAREPIPLTAVLLARICRTPLVLQPHGMLTSRVSRAHRLFDRLVTLPIIGRDAVFIALTEVEARDLLRWAPRHVRTVETLGNPLPIGLEPEPRDLHGKSGGDVVFIARLHPRKRVLDFAAAAAKSATEGWTEHYAVVGPDEGDRDELLARATELDNLTYEGAVDAVGVLDRLRRADVFVLPSLNEPWGNVLVAALQLNRPVVITRSSALAALVERYGAGVVVDDGDPDAIAQAVHAVLRRDAYAKYVAGAGRLAAANFDPDVMAKRLREVYSVASAHTKNGSSASA